MPDAPSRSESAPPESPSWADERFEQLRVERRGAALTVTLHRPERLNAFTPTMGAELLTVLDRADADDDVRAVIITGSGRAFCAGADLSSTADPESGNSGAHSASASASGAGARFAYPDPANHRDLGGQISLRLFESLKPVIVAFNGPAVGAGITMMLAADIRLASTDAKFGFVFARRGIVLEAASSWFLPRVVGISRAMEWVSTGRIFGADEARAAGLVRSVHEPAALIPAALALADEIAACTAPVSVALNRQMLWRMLGASHPIDAHELDSRALADRGASADAREGISSFLEKRSPRFPDRVSSDLPQFYPWWPPRPFTPLNAAATARVDPT